jgi:hypothetical protein
MGRGSSDELYWRLMLEGMRPKTVGAVDGRNEKAGRSRNGAARQVASGSREEFGGHPTEPSPERQNRPVLQLVSSRHRGAQRRTGTPPCLILINGGKA